MKLVPIKFYLALFFLFICSCFLFSDEEQKMAQIVLPLYPQDVQIKIKGSKVRESRLKTVIFSDILLMQSKSVEEVASQVQLTLLNTGLFEKVVIEKAEENLIEINIKDTITLLPIVNFSTNLENFSYTLGASESNLFHRMMRIGGSYSHSRNAEGGNYWFGLVQPTANVQSVFFNGLHGDNFFYYNDSWYRIDQDELMLTATFKRIFKGYRFLFGGQLRHSRFNFLEETFLSYEGHFSIDKFHRNHDVSYGDRFHLSARYLDNRFNRYTFNADFKKHYFFNFHGSPVFRGVLLNLEIGYSLIEEDRSALGAIFAHRNGALHGLRSNSVFEKHFGYFNSRLGVTSRKFLWTYWQPHVFFEAAISDHHTYYSVGGGLLLTFTPLFNSRLRIQYYTGEMPDRIDGFVISTTLDF